MGLFSKKKDDPLQPVPPTIGQAFKERRDQGVTLVDYGRHKGLAIHETAHVDPVTDEKTFAGIRLYGPPVEVGLPRSTVEKGIAAKWITPSNPEIVYLHCGPPEDPTRKVDAVTHYKYLTFHTLDGDITYEITQNPNREDRSYYGRAI